MLDGREDLVVCLHGSAAEDVREILRVNLRDDLRYLLGVLGEQRLELWPDELRETHGEKSRLKAAFPSTRMASTVTPPPPPETRIFGAVLLEQRKVLVDLAGEETLDA